MAGNGGDIMVDNTYLNIILRFSLFIYTPLNSMELTSFYPDIFIPFHSHVAMLEQDSRRQL
jgi:hypothetical protein